MARSANHTVLVAEVMAQGHFNLGARWLVMEDPIDREAVVTAIHKYQNTWPDSLEVALVNTFISFIL